MKLGWGIIGAAGIADRRTIPGLLKAANAQLVAVMSPTMGKAEAIRAKYNAARAFSNIEDLLADPEVQAVYIASPVKFHKEQAIQAALAGKHILIEKPVALTAADAEEIAVVCKEQGVQLGVGYMMRYHTHHRTMKQLVEQGTIGRIVSCRAQLTCWLPPESNNWRLTWAESGGGALMDMGVHCIDLLQYITGCRVKRVSAFTGNLTFDYEVEDSASVILQLDGNIFGYVDSNYNIPGSTAKCKLEFYGTKGSMVAKGTIGQLETGVLEVSWLTDEGGISDAAAGSGPSEDMPQLLQPPGDLYTRQIESFSHSVLSGSPIEIEIEEAIYVQKIAEAAYASSSSGMSVTLNS
ncbi:MAG: oxidoreductase, glucose--fructoseoxidoreductase [Paenibacillus sp.]|nr:oxidoreductase, glucose--fructoseoxidoreductase [Paenibacillus sp.]